MPTAKLNMNQELVDAIQFLGESEVRRLLDSDHTIDINAVVLVINVFASLGKPDDLLGIDEIGWRSTALGVAAYRGDEECVKLLLDRGADVNTVGGEYGTALCVASYRENEGIVNLLLDRGADVNTVGGKYGTALGVAAYSGNEWVVNLLLDRGADVNTVGGVYGTALGVAVYRDKVEGLLGANHISLLDDCVFSPWARELPLPSFRENERIINLLLDRGADVNTVGGRYGTALGIAAYFGHEEIVTLLLVRGADAIHVGGNYETAQGEYPTALHAARSGKASPDLIALVANAVEEKLTRAMGEIMCVNHSRNEIRVTNWPPFPMPYTPSYTAAGLSHHHLHYPRRQPDTSLANLHSSLASSCLHPDLVFHAGDAITPEQASFPCEVLKEELLSQLLIALVGIDIDKAEGSRAEGVKGWIRNDIRYFISQKFDFGLAYAAARVGWKHFNDDTSISVHRARWLKKAKELDEARTHAIYKHSSTGQELIQSPYSVMPRRLWDLKSNRVVEYRMLHAEMQSTISNDLHTQSMLYPLFWAITHSWTNDMKPLAMTPINQYQWPIPLPGDIDLERDVRAELLSFGAEYVWLDVLCLRQHSGTQKPNDHNSTLDSMKQNEWKIDVPTIGNIYRAAERVVRYFNGLGRPFSEHGWDDPRHWLRRAWTLQEISREEMTFNGGFGLSRDNKRIILNTKGQVGGQTTTLRAAIRPILKLATSLGNRGGCSMYDLAREMARRCASHPTDKVAGLFYLLHTTQLPTYDELMSDEEAWRKCFHVLPFRRKLEILFDFPYRGPEHWYPNWDQLMAWPERDEIYEHTTAKWPHDDATSELVQVEDEASFSVDRIWAISHVLLSTDPNNANEYEVKIGNKYFGFYCPYQFQKSIDTENRQFTLAILVPRHSNNWVVCEEIPRSRKRKHECIDKEGEDVVDAVALRKVGVLRTDSCSELLVGKRDGGSMLKMINCLFF